MTDRNVLLKDIVNLVRDFSDAEFQDRAWSGKSTTEISSPNEMYNMLFNDCAFDAFFQQYSPSMTDEQKVAWCAFKDSLEAYRPFIWLYPNEVLNDPKWGQVRIAAKSFVVAFVSSIETNGR